MDCLLFNPRFSVYPWFFIGITKNSVYEVVSLLAMVGKRGQIEADDYRLHRQEANEIAAMLSGLAKTAHKK
ncbi:MAG: four helix bundle protein [Anaerolineae bacterium]|nr:four helix bundle protein [Anaerolineae bacterium]